MTRGMSDAGGLHQRRLPEHNGAEQKQKLEQKLIEQVENVPLRLAEEA